MNYFTLEKINRLLPVVQGCIFREVVPIRGFRYIESDVKGAQGVDFDDADWQPFDVPGDWGGFDVDAWFRARIEIPESLRGKKLALHFLVGPRDGGGSTAETMLYVNGMPLQAIDYWHEDAVLPEELSSLAVLQIALKAWSGVYRVPVRRRFKEAQLVEIDEPTEAFFHLADTMAQAIAVLDENDLRRVKLEQALNGAFQLVDFIRVKRLPFYTSIREALVYLNKCLHKLQRDELKPTVTAVGHSHIDMAWMWRMERTRQKAQRTFTTVLNLMRQYPEYRYSHSSPQLYEFVKHDAPELFARVKEAVSAGKWEVLGGSWIEMDTLLPGGESLARQVLYGKQFTRRVFGTEPRVLWMPDSFGYTGILPTIMKAGGLEGFFTSVISWSKFNRTPYDLFTWRGLDGSEVLVNFITTPAEFSKNYNYIGRLEPDDVTRTWNNNRQKGFTDEVLLPFGWGDGGGGPTVKMLESARAMENMPGIPSVRMGKVEAYFARLSHAVKGKALPVLDGELYLEGLRGSYTSQARNKRANRKAEILLHEAEWLGTCADLLSGEKRFPIKTMRQAWELLLLNQFHDILSGTSITPVHEDSMRDYAVVERLGIEAVNTARKTIAGLVKHEQGGIVAFNNRGWARRGLVELPWKDEDNNSCFIGENGQTLHSQVVERNGEKRLVVETDEVPAYGYRFFPRRAGQETKLSTSLHVDKHHLENELVSVHLNGLGQIDSMVLKASQRQVLPPGKVGNVLQLFEDRPLSGEAWEIDIFYQDKLTELGAPDEWEAEENGPLRGVIRLKWNFNQSTLQQRVILTSGSARIDFETELDWHENHVLLKAAFPVDVRARTATYDLGFGNLERATHWNTPFDTAHFENPAHQWADLSEEGFGAALLNDCKYGYDVKDNVLRLSLHRSPTEPDPVADQGAHTFTYSFLPHEGGWREGNVREAAWDLNDPLGAVEVPGNPGGILPETWGFFTSEDRHVILDTVKPAEDGDGIILRFFESHGKSNPDFSFRVGKPLRKAIECNLLEDETGEVAFNGDLVQFEVKPFIIKTLKVWFA